MSEERKVDVRLSCPFCGSEKSNMAAQGRYWYIECEKCGASNGLCHTEQQANETWNTRDRLPEPQP